jgi:hypothetical protein
MGETARDELDWFRSRTCADHACVEVGGDETYVYIRDAKLPGSVVLRFTRAEWQAFKDGVRLGDFEDV